MRVLVCVTSLSVFIGLLCVGDCYARGRRCRDNGCTEFPCCSQGEVPDGWWGDCQCTGGTGNIKECMVSCPGSCYHFIDENGNCNCGCGIPGWRHSFATVPSYDNIPSYKIPPGRKLKEFEFRHGFTWGELDRLFRVNGEHGGTMTDAQKSTIISDITLTDKSIEDLMKALHIPPYDH